MEMHHTQAYCLSYIGHISQAGHFIYMASAENLILSKTVLSRNYRMLPNYFFSFSCPQARSCYIEVITL